VIDADEDLRCDIGRSLLRFWEKRLGNEGLRSLLHCSEAKGSQQEVEETDKRRSDAPASAM
jgi:hypothetical protein